MAVNVNRWLGISDTNAQAPVPQPTLAEVLYTPPNPDGSTKSCGNCVLYETARQTCYIHDPKLIISPEMVCGYHVYGEPMERFEYRLPMLPVTPEQSGLVLVEGGTSCSSCKYYDQLESQCHATQNDGEPPFVDPLGCCARWTNDGI